MSMKLRSGKHAVAEGVSECPDSDGAESVHSEIMGENLKRMQEMLKMELEKSQRLQQEYQTKINEMLRQTGDQEWQAQQAPTSGEFRPEPEADTVQRTSDWVERDSISRMAAAIAEAMRLSLDGATTRSDTDERRIASLMARQTSAKDLPTFTGEPEEWPVFKAQYSQSTEMCGLSDSENLLRLQRALRGKARDAVAALLIEPKNVATILRTLEGRFGNPTAIVATTMERIRKLPRLPDNPTTEAFVEFAEAIMNAVITVEGLDKKYLAEPQLLYEIISKLPFAARWDWWKVCSQEEPATLEKLSAWLMKMHDSAPFSGCLNPQAHSKGIRRKDGHVLQISDNYIRDNSECILCKEDHKIVSCPLYLEKSGPDRWAVVKNNRLCYVCLATTHRVLNCRVKRCGIDSCKKPHHRSLHTSVVKRSDESSVNSVVANTWQQGYPVMLKVLPVTLSGPKGQVRVHALLDEGSTVTLVDAEAAERLGVHGPVRGLKIHGANGMCSSDDTSRRVRLKLQGDSDANYTISANTVNNLDLPKQWVARNREDLRHLGKRAKEVKPQVLIGQDNAHLIVTREIQEVSGDSCMMSRTALGWTVHGGSRAVHGYQDTMLLTVSVESRLEQLVKEHFAVEALGVSCAMRQESMEDRKAKEIMESTTRHMESGQWETGLLWRGENAQLPNNRSCALTRLLSMEKKISREKELAEKYQQKMEDYLSKGYAEELSASDNRLSSQRTWYLPHFAVKNPNKPGKLRVVFDAASRCRGTSLNDHLLRGPDMLSSLFGNIIRFREGKVAVAADIKEMFLRIKMIKEDQAAQLFLWRKSTDSEVKTYALTSMMFGARCSPSSAQFVRNRVAEEHKAAYPEAVKSILNHFYMDDYLEAFSTHDEAVTRAQEVSLILESGSFELTNWASNSGSVMRSIQEEKRAKADVKIGGDDYALERVLGIRWDPTTDNFIFKIEESTQEENGTLTKRALLAAVMKIFDPVGFITCLTVRSKILLQEVWRSKVGWDEQLTERHRKKWEDWSRLIARIRCEIPRCLTKNKTHCADLHLFCDASELACCVVAYLVNEVNGAVNVVFVASKSKVAPLKPLSIPRLELQAALMAARLAAAIKKECTSGICRTIFWTDSTTVLHWIHSDPRTYSQFVANRLGEIDELTEIESWRWVPTKLNPADLGTRDDDVPDMTLEGLWFSGPSFLRDAEEMWPKSKIHLGIQDLGSLEVKSKFLGVTRCEEAAHSLPNPSRFSSWNRLIRATAWVRRFINRCRRIGPSHTLQAEELLEAEHTWIRYAQTEAFGDDISMVRNGQMIPPRSRLHGLSPVIDDQGQIRVGTRLEKGAVFAKAPILLDGGHPYGRLLICHLHVQAGHASVERTMAEVRDAYFMLKMRSAVRQTVYKCQECRNRKSQPQAPLMGQLPEGRLAYHERPFTHCGLDFWGPMDVTVGRRREKRYGALFTCMSTRAVHLEVASSLSADSTIMAVRRMTARRGQPTAFYSDNGTNFHGANREMREAVKGLKNDAKLNEYLADHRTKWIFNPPSSPHMGGAWERLVRSVKTALYTTLKERAPKEETLLTVLAEVEHTVNSRPLTHVSTDTRDEEPLTPNHFLIGSAHGRPHLALYSEDEKDMTLRKQWRIAQQMADMFWRRWLKEYTPSIAQRQKWKIAVEPIKAGDVVIVSDPALPRNSWPLGRVVEAIQGSNGQVRAARVKTATGEYVRPAVKLTVLRVNEEDKCVPQSG